MYLMKKANLKELFWHMTRTEQENSKYAIYKAVQVTSLDRNDKAIFEKKTL